MENVRKSTFETNSSSSHSIVIKELQEGDVLDLGYLTPNDEGILYVGPGQFGWETARHRDSGTKASYLLTSLMLTKNSVEEFNRVLFDVTEAKMIMLSNSLYNRDGAIDGEVGDEDHDDYSHYIDHESYYVPQQVLSGGYEAIKNFIFNPASILYTGNDNDDGVYELRLADGNEEPRDW